jgi:hypothetical protein
LSSEEEERVVFMFFKLDKESSEEKGIKHISG